MNIDLQLFNLINGLAGKWQWLDYLAMFFARYFEYFLLLALLIFLIVNFKKHWKMAAESVVVAVFARFVLAEIIRLVWFRPRPFVVENFIPLISQNSAEASFPSGHASFYFALSTIIYCYNKKAGILFFIASFLIALSRIFVGVHWPSDILVGALIGILIGWLGYKISKKYLK